MHLNAPNSFILCLVAKDPKATNKQEGGLTQGKAEALGHHSLLNGWQATGTVDLQVRRAADPPVCWTQCDRKGIC